MAKKGGIDSLTIGVVALGVGVAYFGYNAWTNSQKLTPAPTTTPTSGPPAPYVPSAATFNQMYLQWVSDGSHLDQAGWVASMSKVLPFSTDQLNQLYSQINGYHLNLLAHGIADGSASWPTSAMVIAWITAIGSQGT